MNLETNSRPSRDASQDGLAVDDGPIFPMFSRKADQDAWLRQQEEKRRLAAEQDDRAKRPLLADYIKHPLPVLEYFRVKVSRNLDDDTMTGACAYSSDSRGALRELHKVGRMTYSLKSGQCLTHLYVASVTLDLTEGEVRYEEANGSKGGVLLSAVEYLSIAAGRLRCTYQDLEIPKA